MSDFEKLCDRLLKRHNEAVDRLAVLREQADYAVADVLQDIARETDAVLLKKMQDFAKHRISRERTAALPVG